MTKNFDEDYKDFKFPTADLANIAANKANLERLGIDPNKDDTVFGALFVYCGSHRRAHTVGWCEVDISRKRPLSADSVDASEAEAAALFTEGITF